MSPAILAQAWRIWDLLSLTDDEYSLLRLDVKLISYCNYWMN